MNTTLCQGTKGRMGAKNVWRGMKERCHSPTSRAYKNYGARGIKVYEPWRNSYDEFLAYVSTLPGFGEPNVQLDRIDNDGDYEPGNVRWVTQKVQLNNCRRNHLVEALGETHTIAEWADITGIKYKTLCARIIDYGWDAERAILEPVKKACHRKRYDLDAVRLDYEMYGPSKAAKMNRLAYYTVIGLAKDNGWGTQLS